MNFIQNLTFVEMMLAIITIAVSVIAFKIVVSFDINKWQENRVKNIERKLQLNCTHSLLNVREDGLIEAQSLFDSPSGTQKWICSKCHVSTDDDKLPLLTINYFVRNIREYGKANQRFNKLLKKLS